MPGIERLTVFDCNASYGVSARPPPRYAATAGELLAEMDYCGIDRALVFHTNQRFSSPSFYNTQLVRDVRRLPRLTPSWVILPPQTEELPPLNKLALLMKRNGIRALRAFPDEHRYRLDGRTFGKLFEWMSANKIPLFVKLNAMALGDLLKEFPALTVIAVNQGPHSFERYLRPLMETSSLLFLETSYLIVEGLIEGYCRRYGAARLLFGSAFPDNCAGGALTHLACADIPAADRAAIAGNNLTRLLSEAHI